MARGWESKSVEAQQEERAARRPSGPAPGPQDLEKAERRRTLELSRTRMENDLSRAGSPAHRRMLEQAIAALDEQLAAIDADRVA